MSVARQADTSASKTGPDHNMLWTQDDLDLWHGSQSVRCIGTTSPKVIRGEVVPGRRCKNWVTFPVAWLVVAPLSPPPVVLCWAHTGQRRALLEAHQ